VTSKSESERADPSVIGNRGGRIAQGRVCG